MYSAIHLPQAHHRKLSLAVLSAMLCLASAASLAATAKTATASTWSNPALQQKTPGLKLDLGMAVKGDECEEDYADLMQGGAARGGAPAAAPVRPAKAGGDVLLAKLSAQPDFAAYPAPATVDIPVASTASTPPVAAAVPAARGAKSAPAKKLAAPVAAAPAAAAPPAVALPAGSWEVLPSDKTLNAAMARWAAAAGWQLLWELPVDYAVSVRTEIRGTFAEAVGQVTKSMDTAEIPMKAIFYDGNRVLRIVAKGTE